MRRFARNAVRVAKGVTGELAIMACGADGRRAPFVKRNISDVMSCDLLRWRVCSILQRRSDRHWLNSRCVSPDACVYVLWRLVST